MSVSLVWVISFELLNFCDQILCGHAKGQGHNEDKRGLRQCVYVSVKYTDIMSALNLVQGNVEIDTLQYFDCIKILQLVRH